MKTSLFASLCAAVVLVWAGPGSADDWKDEPRHGPDHGYLDDGRHARDAYTLYGDRRYIPPEVAAIPPGHYPPPGHCRDWYPDRPPGHQPPPYRC